MRLTDVKVDDSDVDRAHHEWVRAMTNMFTDRFGAVDGVVFDLRHDLLAIDEWKMPNFGVSPSVVHDDPDQPKLWFPWFGPAEIGEVWPTSRRSRTGSAAGSADLNHNGEMTKSPLKIETIIRAGDQIVIEKVVSALTEHELVHPHDSEIRCAYLLIKRQDGNKISPAIPLKFHGRKGLLNEKYPMGVLTGIERRIDEYFSRDISGIETNSYAKRALLELRDIQGMLGASEFYNTSEFVDRALFLGYLWAHAEVDLKLKPLAMARQAQSRASSKGAKKGVETRRKEAANKEWRQRLKPFAIDYCTKWQTLYPAKRGPSRSKIASDFQSAWVGDEKELPEHSTIINQIKILEDTGQLERVQLKNRS